MILSHINSYSQSLTKFRLISLFLCCYLHQRLIVVIRNYMNKSTKINLDEYTIASSDLFSDQEIREFLLQLVKKKQELLSKSQGRIVSGEIIHDSNEMADELDMASVNVEQSVILKLLDREQHQLSQINHALNKIASGDYGYCEGTGDPIPKKRLALNPWTRYSVGYQETLEKNNRNSTPPS